MQGKISAYKILSAKKTNRKGFVLMLEATISILVFLLLILALPQNNPQSLKELAALEQANDLLKVWSVKNTTQNEMITDTNMMFGSDAELWVDEKQILAGKKTKNTISTEGIIIDETLLERKIKISVNYN